MRCSQAGWDARSRRGHLQAPQASSTSSARGSAGRVLTRAVLAMAAQPLGHGAGAQRVSDAVDRKIRRPCHQTVRNSAFSG